ncbi:TldD/PmbA family protein [Texas Phoenix palm phytoplasma]|uniref:TldD/PmbA family protein n=1 Tax=Texas Phoenix palm phytoplasma TaxID=176709 RepID=A0ABS5BID2_9MOLU|nr:metallopeptidase TldD-related protein [Texas Phoenix palm phytoplasma]MBP3059348.1 TldD/PmbA family protein [Texas Phoenix palm phytoplasma]
MQTNINLKNENLIDYKKWFLKSFEKKIDALEILLNDNKTLNIILEDNKINEYIKSDLFSVIIRGLYQNKKTSIYLEKINDEIIDEVLETLKKQIEILSFPEKDFIFDGSDSSYHTVEPILFDFVNVPMEQKYNLLFEFEKKLFEKSRFLTKIESISYEENFFHKKIVNSKGLDLEEKESYACLSAVCIFKKDKNIEEIVKYFPVKKFSSFDIDKYVEEIISLGESKLGALSLSSGSYPVVFSNEMFSKLLSSFSDIFSGNQAYQKLSKLLGKENQKIASSKVTIIDDPLFSDSFFKSTFDDEGVPCKNKYIIKEGIFKQFIHNLRTSNIFKTEPTGNFFDGYISMSNCYLKKGTKSFKEMISSIDDGVYIDYLIGLHAGVNSISGDFSIQASGFKIEKGNLISPFKMVVVSGNFFDILINLKEIANDFVFKFSGFGSSSVYVGDLTIAGEK